jgi:DNA-binding winged helix-turn-helix (wHTH) protein/TolB-like protein
MLCTCETCYTLAMTHYNTSEMTQLRCAGLVFDTQLGRVGNARGEEIRLSPIALKLLRELLAHAGEPLLRTQLFDSIWPNQTLSDDVLTRAVSDLRGQLAQLDPANKFIETLPRRGYCWILPIEVAPVDAPSLTASNPDDLVAPFVETIPPKIWRKSLVSASVYFICGVILALAVMALYAQKLGVQRYRIAVLPTEPERPLVERRAHWLDDVLVLQLRKNKTLDLLSKSAVASRPSKPFPYFNAEFGARWVLEPRLREDEGLVRVDIALVDARTGLELRSLTIEESSDAEIVSELAKRLDEWLADLR